ncbi:hypothetical protein AYL99_06419 [Fonsecaea erecta]|uniref:Uncharacterized protein n=1 Tax=Fonsecaea erecta TaxID=1367422 RepID=A0A178ZI19_9EURO|nr:hypothetical protein AYL99_06419 [Fonsecaea erecta]OAP59121.1 hypothetical protein AYL99_06419 [Fonsecaea erecta]
MATPRRRSARLSKAAQQQHASPRKMISSVQLESLVERDETPDVGEPQSIDNVLATPTSSSMIKSQLSKLSGLKTPRTEPQADRGEMHPHLVHQTTTKAPDSGLKLGFVDVPAHPPRSIASAQNTPSKARMNTPAGLSSTNFDFNFGSESQLSSEAQKLMHNVREDVARIKAQMQVEREAQKQKDSEAEGIFGGVNATGRKIAKPRGKAGRFSDVHMAQFKKMDSIANHPSAFRGRPGFAQPTTQSLKRSGSKAGLDEADRPRTAGKGTPGRKPPPFLGRPTSTSPFKSIMAQVESVEPAIPAKRARRSELHDVSASRPSEQPPSVRPTTLPRPVSSSLLSPTKASLARATTSQIPIASPNKAHSLTRATSSKSLRAPSAASDGRPSASHGESSTEPSLGLQQKGSIQVERPLPPLPREEHSPSVVNTMPRSRSIAESAVTTNASGFSSRLPKFSGLKSILRPGRKTDMLPLIDDKQATPKRPNTATTNGSHKKVDFTPSVKSRYAVKLAAGSPSPAKLPHLTPGKALPPVVPYDPAAYTVEDEDVWEDASSEIEYPALPHPSSSPAAPPKLDNAFAEKAKEHNRRESKEFKSIFTTLHHPSRSSGPSTLTSVNTMVNKADPTTHAHDITRSPSNRNFFSFSPSTIRRVRSSGVTDVVQPFEDAEVKTVPHGLPGKKRRRASTVSDDHQSTDEESSKENRRISVMPNVPGGWENSSHISCEDEQDEGEKRGGKRLRTAPAAGNLSDKTIAAKTLSPVKKPRQSSAREMAKQNAKDRKSGRGILSLSRLNMLARPKQRS